MKFFFFPICFLFVYGQEFSAQYNLTSPSLGNGIQSGTYYYSWSLGGIRRSTGSTSIIEKYLTPVEGFQSFCEADGCLKNYYVNTTVNSNNSITYVFQPLEQGCCSIDHIVFSVPSCVNISEITVMGCVSSVVQQEEYDCTGLGSQPIFGGLANSPTNLHVYVDPSCSNPTRRCHLSDFPPRKRSITLSQPSMINNWNKDELKRDVPGYSGGWGWSWSWGWGNWNYWGWNNNLLKTKPFTFTVFMGSCVAPAVGMFGVAGLQNSYYCSSCQQVVFAADHDHSPEWTYETGSCGCNIGIPTSTQPPLFLHAKAEYQSVNQSDSRNCEKYVRSGGEVLELWLYNKTYPCKVVFSNGDTYTFSNFNLSVQDSSLFIKPTNECICTSPLDIALVIDSSMYAWDFANELDALASFVSNFDVSYLNTRFAVLQGLRNSPTKFGTDVILQLTSGVTLSNVNSSILSAGCYNFQCGNYYNTYCCYSSLKQNMSSDIITAANQLTNARSFARPVIVEVTQGRNIDNQYPTVFHNSITYAQKLVPNLVIYFVAVNTGYYNIPSISEFSNVFIYNISDFYYFNDISNYLAGTICNLQDYPCGTYCCGECICGTCAKPSYCEFNTTEGCYTLGLSNITGCCGIIGTSEQSCPESPLSCEQAYCNSSGQCGYISQCPVDNQCFTYTCNSSGVCSPTWNDSRCYEPCYSCYCNTTKGFKIEVIAKSCEPPNACFNGSCDSQTGTCIYLPIDVPDFSTAELESLGVSKTECYSVECTVNSTGDIVWVAVSGTEVCSQKPVGTCQISTCVVTDGTGSCEVSASSSCSNPDPENLCQTYAFVNGVFTNTSTVCDSGTGNCTTSLGCDTLTGSCVYNSTICTVNAECAPAECNKNGVCSTDYLSEADIEAYETFCQDNECNDCPPTDISSCTYYKCNTQDGGCQLADYSDLCAEFNSPASLQCKVWECTDGVGCQYVYVSEGADPCFIEGLDPKSCYIIRYAPTSTQCCELDFKTAADCEEEYASNPCFTYSDCDFSVGYCQPKAISLDTLCSSKNLSDPCLNFYCNISTTNEAICEVSEKDCSSYCSNLNCSVCSCDQNLGGCIAQDICNDNNPCTEDTCVGYMKCTHTQVNSSICDDGNLCTVDVCDVSLKECTYSSVVCDFGCTVNSYCDPSIGCVRGQNLSCNDYNPCTDDLCTGGACSFTPVVCPVSDNPCVVSTCSSKYGCVNETVQCSTTESCSISVCESYNSTTSYCSHETLQCDALLVSPAAIAGITAGTVGAIVAAACAFLLLGGSTAYYVAHNVASGDPVSVHHNPTYADRTSGQSGQTGQGENPLNEFSLDD